MSLYGSVYGICPTVGVAIGNQPGKAIGDETSKGIQFPAPRPVYPPTASPMFMPPGTLPFSRIDNENSVLQAHARILMKNIKAALPLVDDKAARDHLLDCSQCYPRL